MPDSYNPTPEFHAAKKKVDDLIKKWTEEDLKANDPDRSAVITYERALELNKRSRELGAALKELEDTSKSGLNLN